MGTKRFAPRQCASHPAALLLGYGKPFLVHTPWFFRAGPAPTVLSTVSTADFVFGRSSPDLSTTRLHCCPDRADVPRKAVGCTRPPADLAQSGGSIVPCRASAKTGRMRRKASTSPRVIVQGIVRTEARRDATADVRRGTWRPLHEVLRRPRSHPRPHRAHRLGRCTPSKPNPRGPARELCQRRVGGENQCSTGCVFRHTGCC